ncbi:acyl-CoA N-acyltransferase [Boletus edulis]|nr:acyl-CoA N-acyltransferase [Boletus edulis]
MAEPMHSEESSRQAFLVRKNGMDPHPSPASDDHTFLHYQGSDKQLDEWMTESELLRADALASRTNNGKRKREVSTTRPGSPTNSTRQSSLEAIPLLPDVKTATASPKDTMTEEDFDAVQRYKQTAAQRNFDKVIFGQWQIKTWYYSPYPLTESEAEESAPAQDRSSTPTLKTSGSVMWVCDRCFKYMAEGSTWELHVKKCDRRHPPGRKVYQRGAHTIWEVDGAKEKLYCQNLSLFGKLFIDVKTLFFDCDNCEDNSFSRTPGLNDSQRDHILGFFSKEKFSYDDYNLACIIVLPPYQRKGYGMLMIEFSYELSRKTGKVGTPERPLSDLGLRSYLTYWVATLIRFFRRLLTVLPPEYVQVTTDQWIPDLSQLQSTEDNMIDDVASTTSTPHHFDALSIEVLNGLRRIETTSNPDGSATSHVVVRCTLGDIARATNLRVEDAAFALNECGLLTHVQRDRDGAREQIGVTREMIEAVAKERRVKEMCMSLAHVLL